MKNLCIKGTYLGIFHYKALSRGVKRWINQAWWRYSSELLWNELWRINTCNVERSVTQDTHNCFYASNCTTDVLHILGDRNVEKLQRLVAYQLACSTSATFDWLTCWPRVIDFLRPFQYFTSPTQCNKNAMLFIFLVYMPMMMYCK